MLMQKNVILFLTVKSGRYADFLIEPHKTVVKMMRFSLYKVQSLFLVACCGKYQNGAKATSLKELRSTNNNCMR